MSAASDRDQLARLLLPELECPNHGSDYGACVDCGAIAERIGDAVWAAGWRPNTDTTRHDAAKEALNYAASLYAEAADNGLVPALNALVAQQLRGLAERYPHPAPVVGDAGPPPTDDELRSDDDERQADIQRDAGRGY